eukprot:5482144-Amphidinium_carterae.1
MDKKDNRKSPQWSNVHFVSAKGLCIQDLDRSLLTPAKAAKCNMMAKRCIRQLDSLIRDHPPRRVQLQVTVASSPGNECVRH